MKTASLRTYLYKSVIVGLVPVLAIVNLQSGALAVPKKESKSKTPDRTLTAKIGVSAPAKKAVKAKPPAQRVVAPQNNFADSYTLGPGDRLRVDIFNVPEYSGEFNVLGDGAINLPVIGAVPVQGLTVQRASALLTAYFSRYVKRPIVTISVTAPRPVQFAIAGEVTRSGSYTVPFTGENRKFPTVSQAIQLAGGTTQTANLRQVQVRRAATGRIISVNIFDVLQRGNTSQDITLRDGDTIFIARSEGVNAADRLRLAGSNLANQDATVKVAILGEVGKPGTYTLKGETAGTAGRVTPPTLTEAIKIAGGSTASADLSRIRVRRNTRTGVGQVVPINLLNLLKAGDFGQDIILQDGDTILLPTATEINSANSILISASNLGPQAINPPKVVVVGEVNRPGTYTVTGAGNTTNNNTQLTGTVALPTVTNAIQSAAGIKPTADIRQIQLIRTTRTGEQRIALNLFKLLQQGDTSQDIILQEGDRIFIPVAQNSSPQDVDLVASSTLSPATIRVNVIGEIANKAGRGGTIEMPPNTTLNQALLIAGGFDNVRANKNEVDFIRLNPNGTVTKRLIKLNFTRGIDPETNPRLQNNDTIVIGRNGLTRIGDGFSTILTPFNGILNILRF
ncbi:polysaccharide biosynthesis/export family protein [Chamaesiphon minutus]|uniref:Periplasmic protein involved in polysaccharide export n=1 Tax=Chamaesiphon minutus (strain ATCC 27169 / PCC 6605) TaxID=1173020 RepID=K9UGC2_CHAP6|nr:polysaccharide biosynthesis/export family protein [Chamaesiphon minutus]AFY93713.1 periplasmic protein involved in polysaccharide export [Chamaesiphon minutus PCC 6605]